MLMTGLQTVDPPVELIPRLQGKIQSKSPPQVFKFLRAPWKTVVPALSLAALVVLMLLNPFSGQLRSFDDVAAHYIANHLDTDMEMAFRTEEVNDVAKWFAPRLGYAVRLPDLKQLELNLLGGRKCGLGDIDVALLFCNSKGKRASLFVINQNDVNLDMDKERKYIVSEGSVKVTVWKESNLIYAMVI
jgi:anti-sigma factor RsiW